MGIFGKKTVKTNDKDNAKIKMVEVSQLRFDRDLGLRSNKMFLKPQD